MDPVADLWQPTPSELRLGVADIHLWRIDLPAALRHCPAFIDLLSPEEQQRRKRFRHTGARDAFMVGRGVLRLLLGEYTGIPPKNLQLAYTPSGKPYLAGAPDQADVSFNLSHSGAWIVLGFGVKRPIGIDLEYREERPRVTELARRFLAPEEISLILATGEESRHQTFYDLWVQKEAYLKALGTGLSRSLKAFTILAAVPGALTLFYPEHPPNTVSKEPEAWLRYSFSVDPAYASALVTSPGPASIYHFHWLPKTAAHEG